VHPLVPGTGATLLLGLVESAPLAVGLLEIGGGDGFCCSDLESDSNYAAGDKGHHPSTQFLLTRGVGELLQQIAGNTTGIFLGCFEA